MNATERWPELPLEPWKDTYETLHRWTQIVGKIRLVQTQWMNHSWHVPLYVTTRGLTTSPIPYDGRSFSIDFDFCDHRLVVRTDDGTERAFPLRPQSVAAFYHEVMETLRGLDIHVTINTMPSEIEDATPFDEDTEHASYDAEMAKRCWRILVQVDRVFRKFRAGFAGKCSPVHFFWGAFDLAVTRFSGRPAPEHPGGIPNLPDWVVREAYSHENSSAGFWPGGGPHPFPLFFSYVYPEPEGFRDYAVRPDAAFYSEDLREFILPYDAVRQADDPDAVLLDFLESTYVAAAERGGWDREALEFNVPRRA